MTASPKRSVLPSLSLRYKIGLILLLYVIGLLARCFVAQKDLAMAKEKLEVVEYAYRLNALLLEVRRYEKNYLLYGTEEALQENSRQIESALQLTETITERVLSFKAHPMLVQLKELLLSYRAQMRSLYGRDIHDDSVADRLRSDGQKMNELCEELVNFEHRQIRLILNELVHQLILWICVAAAFGGVVLIAMCLKIFRPLTIIKRATREIACGRFLPVPVVNTRDEMQQVMEAFNIMVDELQRRQEQLVQSQKLSSIGTLSAGIAHQLNNPLNNVSTSCQIAISELKAGKTDLFGQMLVNIDQETNRARDVVQGLLEFAREKEFERRPFHLAAVVDRAIMLVRSQVPSLVAIKSTIASDLLLPMDAQRMQEVFINLILNGAQAITGSGEITLSAAFLDAGERVVIEVHDTGSGIPQEIQARLFDPFFTTKSVGEGTGLGLSITYGIIERHQGKIRVKSAPDKGTSFLIELPCMVSDLVSDLEAAAVHDSENEYEEPCL